MMLMAEGPGIRIGAPRQPLPAEIAVEDPFGRDEPAGGAREEAGEARPLATGRLYRPCDFVQVSAFAADPAPALRQQRGAGIGLTPPSAYFFQACPTW